MTETGSLSRAVVLAVVATLVMASGAAGATARAEEPSTEPAFVIALDADGGARVTLTVAFDLTTDGERSAFESLRENETARERRAAQFAARLQTVAASAETATGREMAVRDPGVTFARQNETGVVSLSVTWAGLAAREGNRLVLREPFTSGFDPDRAFSVVGPEGYELATVHPAPTSRTANSATWDAGTRLDSFATTFAPTDEPSATRTGDGESSADGPGFGVGVAVLAVLASAVALAGRDRLRRR